ncbi:MAG TPA: cupin domain-containing protein [Gaiellaceae bacterium]|jgi:quercetin dioxygenase-like cupin family protein
MTDVVKLGQTEGRELAPGVRMRPLFGVGAMLNLIDFEPNARVPEHSHPHEQLGIVMEGELTMLIDGVEHPLGPGDAYQIDGDVPHGAWTGDAPCRVLDVFHPVREDYRS